MTLKTHTITKKKDTHNQTWEWEETPELLAALEKLEESSRRVEAIKVPNIHVPNQNYARKKRENV